MCLRWWGRDWPHLPAGLRQPRDQIRTCEQPPPVRRFGGPCARVELGFQRVALTQAWRSRGSSASSSRAAEGAGQAGLGALPHGERRGLSSPAGPVAMRTDPPPPQTFTTPFHNWTGSTLNRPTRASYSNVWTRSALEDAQPVVVFMSPGLREVWLVYCRPRSGAGPGSGRCPAVLTRCSPHTRQGRGCADRSYPTTALREAVSSAVFDGFQNISFSSEVFRALHSALSP